MKDPLLYSQQQAILSGESTLDTFNILLDEIKQQGQPSRSFYDFVANHHGCWWDKKFFEVALAYGLYDLADALIAKIAHDHHSVAPWSREISFRSQRDTVEEKNNLRKSFIAEIDRFLASAIPINDNHLRQMKASLQYQEEEIITLSEQKLSQQNKY